MKKIMQVFLLFIFVFAVYACIPVPVYVSPSAPSYEQPYSYDDQYGAGYDDEYVDVPIVYGEPMYYAPPIAVTFAFDYFTYEMVGGYVDVVFWRGGHRYRDEPWRDHGRRISPDDIRVNPYHRIRSTEFSRHREKLQKNNNITHPDSYYGIKPRPKQQIQPSKQIDQRPPLEQQPPRQVEQQPQWGQKPPKQVDQKPSWGQKQPQPVEQKPQWGQKPPQQVQPKPQWGQKQPQPGTLRQPPEQTKQRYQQEQQKLQQEKQKKLKERLKKPEQEQEKEKEEMTKRPPRPRE
ncbi:MAG: hypothetical protein NTW65_10170 [Deltaproteobacteria bacterium]|nr:hypothetical protein [Deltaproteobacteria bacterium]